MQTLRARLGVPCGSARLQRRGIESGTNSRRSTSRLARPAAAAAPPPPSDGSDADQRRAEAQEALLAALLESGVPLSNIQLGRSDDDDEEWLDVLDAETDEWMRKPQVPEIVEELLGGDVAAAARQMDEEQQRRREERRRQQQQQQQQAGGSE